MQGSIGEIKIFAGNYAPKSWKFCHGQVLNIADYPAAHAVIGTAYGGDGITTFQLPDMRGRTLVGAGHGAGLSERIFGTTGGAETVTLTSEQLPAHSHGATATVTGTVTPKCLDDTGLNDSPGGQYPAVCSDSTLKLYTNATQTPDATMGSSPIDATASVTVASAGGGQAVVVTNPYIAVHYIICVEAFMPS